VTVDILKIAAITFVAVVLQTSILSSVELGGATPDLLLVTLVAIALLRGAITGAAVGFAAGLLIDTATLARLGETSLLLTIVGYWIGRYGETTGRDRSHAPILSVAVVTVLYGCGALFLRVVLGDPVDASALFRSLLPAILLNLLLTFAVYALVRRIVGRPAWAPQEVRLLG
jgi:rod shape-determining protein MreD